MKLYLDSSITPPITANSPLAEDLKYASQFDMAYVELRYEVVMFALLMERKLRKNDHKTGWRELPIEALRRLMMVEIEEFNVAREFFGLEEARKELVDIANFAMMLHDRLGVKENVSEEVSA